MKLLLSIVFLIFSFSAEADIGDLAKEYLQTNSEVLKSKAQISTSFLNISSIEAQNIWSLTYAGTKEDDNLEQVSPFSVRDTSITNHFLSLGKGFSWGGELALNNSLTKYDSPATAGAINGFRQGFSYTQDLGSNFLGRDFYSKLKMAQESHTSNEAKLKYALQSSLYRFAISYSQAKLNFSLLKLQKEAKERADRRKSLVARRVRDGLKEKVDLIQARIAVLSAQEQVKSAEMNRSSSLESLSNFLHRKVSKAEINTFDSNILDQGKIPNGDTSSNLEILSLDKKVEALKLSKTQVDYSFWPKLSAGFEYNVNDYDTNQSTAFEEGLLTGNRNASETVLSLNAVWTFGNEVQKIARSRNNIELSTAIMERDKLKLNFSKTEESLRTQIDLLEKNIISVKTRKNLTTQALKEMGKLYNKGRADLDQVIRAEESLINTEINFVQYLAQREGLIYQLASLYGVLEEYLVK